MGIYGNATCQMFLGGVVGSLVDEPSAGLNEMLVMINAARQGVGTQGVGLTEVARQNAMVHAKDRIQMRSLSGPNDQPLSRPARSRLYTAAQFSHYDVLGPDGGTQRWPGFGGW